MNNLRNRVQLIGNLGSDPEIKIFESGKKKVKLFLKAHSEFKAFLIFENDKGELETLSINGFPEN